MKLLVVFTLILVHQCHCQDDWLPKLPNVLDVMKTNIRILGKKLRDKFTEYFKLDDDNQKFVTRVLILRKKLEQSTTPINRDKQVQTTTLTNSFYVKRRNRQMINTKPSTKKSKMSKILGKYLDNPFEHMTTPQIIAAFGYAAESHTILTDDGYLLTIHRIPFPKHSKKEVPHKTVLLHHGLLGSSADWVLSGPERGLAFILSDAGYDVWMANVRGNTYSRAHISKPVDSFVYWNFSFHEVSQHDLPAVIDYIMELKGWEIKINYIGHSMGTTVLFALLSTKPQYNKILRAGFALAPVAYMSHIKSPIRLLAKFANNIEHLIKLLGAKEFLPHNELIKFLSKYACEMTNYEVEICENSIFYICGFDPKQFNRTLLPIILGHEPAGASTKTIVHYAQEIRNGRFQQFDYGPEGNLKRYGTILPPEYPVTNITLPIALLSAENDWLSSETDVLHLFVQLANPIEHYIVPLKNFNHIDFLWAVDAPALVYNKLLQLLEEGVTHYSITSNEVSTL